MAFDVLDLATVTNLRDSRMLNKLNKTIRKAKNNNYEILFPCLESLNDITIVLFTDASYANLSDQVSSAGGYIIFIRNKEGKKCPVSWSSKKIRRIVKSTLAAEALSLIEGLNECYYIRSILAEMIPKTEQSVHIECFIDNKSLCQNIHSTKLISEKRLRLDIASIKESVNRGDVTISWIGTDKQIADCLTKAGADYHRLIEVLRTGNGP